MVFCQLSVHRLVTPVHLSWSRMFALSKTAQLRLLSQPHSLHDSTNHNPEPLPTTVRWARSLPGPLLYHFWLSVLENCSLHTQSSPTTEKIWPIVWASSVGVPHPSPPTSHTRKRQKLYYVLKINFSLTVQDAMKPAASLEEASLFT